MKIAVPKELKNHEYRVGLVPGAVRELVLAGHQVMVETEAGLGIGYNDQHYRDVGAQVIKNVDQLYNDAELIIKVKEPLAAERQQLHTGHILFHWR